MFSTSRRPFSRMGVVRINELIHVLVECILAKLVQSLA